MADWGEAGGIHVWLFVLVLPLAIRLVQRFPLRRIS